MIQHAFARLWQLMILVAMFSVIVWILTHPQTAAGALVTVITGVKTFVTTLINSIAGLF